MTNYKHSLPLITGVSLIVYGIMQFPIYYFMILLSYNNQLWFEALEYTGYTPFIVFYSIILIVVAVLFIVGGIALLILRDTKLPHD